MQKIKLTFVLVLSLIVGNAFALIYQDQTPIPEQADTVIMKIGDKSSINIFIADKEDLKKIQKVDLNAVVRKIGGYMDSTSTKSEDKKSNVDINIKVSERNIEGNSDKEDGNYQSIFRDRHFFRRNWQFHLDFGLNNYFENSMLPSDQKYGLDFANSRYVAFGLSYRVLLVRGVNFRFGTEIAWNNFMYRQDVRISKTSEGVDYIDDGIDYQKSKLAMSTLNFPVMLQLAIFDNLRIGVGGHVGFLLDSYNKVVLPNGDVQREQSNFNLNNMRYGLRGEIGGRDIKFFINYDMTPLFAKSSANLQAFSFGIRL